MSQRQFINRANVSLPSQSYPPGLDSVVGIIVSRRAKLDVLIRMAVRSRKDLLHPLVELPGKRRQVFGGVEFRILQLLWLRVEQSVCGWNVRTHLGPSPLPSLSQALPLAPSLK